MVKPIQFIVISLKCLISLNISIKMENEKIDFLNLVVSLLPDCVSDEVKHFIASQFALESNFGKSPLACCNKNYSGMKVPISRITVALNLRCPSDFASYSGITYCVLDYLLWLQFNKFSRNVLSNVDLFSHYLELSGYCPEHDYISKIKTIYSKYYGCTK